MHIWVRRMAWLGVAALIALTTMSSAALAERISFWGQGTTNPVLTQLIGEFTEETGIEVDIRTIGYGLEEVIVAMAAGAPPDLFSHGAAALGAFGASGQLLPLDSYVDKWDFIHDMVPEVRQTGVYEGKQLVMPWRGLSIRDLAYRVDMFEEAGLGDPPGDWDDLVDYGRKLVRVSSDGHMVRSGISLSTTGPGSQQVFSMFHHQLGGDIIVDGQSGLADDSAMEALEFYVDLINRHDIAGSGRVVVGTTAMQWSTGTAVQDIREFDMLDDIRLAPFPYARQRATFMAADWIAIPAGASNRNGALRFLEFMLRPDIQNRYNEAMGTIPFYHQAFDWDWVRDNQAIMHLMSAVPYGVGNPPHEHWFDLRDVLVDTVQRALRLEQPAASLLLEADRLVNQILSK